MKLRPLVLAARLFWPTSRATAPANDAVREQAASLVVAIVQHGEGISCADISDLSAQLDAQVAAAPGVQSFATPRWPGWTGPSPSRSLPTRRGR